MSLKKRILIFMSLWLVAGLVSAFCSDVTAEAGESEFFGRLHILYFAPLVAAFGTAFTLAHGYHYSTWQQRDYYQSVVTGIMLLIFVVHAVVTLTHTRRRAFLVCCGIQIVLLSITTVCALYFYHYDSTHGHG